MTVAVCPHCKNMVVPQKDIVGQLLCPLCENTGQATWKAASTPAGTPPTFADLASPLQPAFPHISGATFPQGPGHSAGVPNPVYKKAVARADAHARLALIMGCVSVAIVGFAIMEKSLVFGLAPLFAIGFGWYARRKLVRLDQKSRAGKANFGIVLGCISLVVLVGLAPYFAAVCDTLSGCQNSLAHNETQVIPAGQTWNFEFETFRQLTIHTSLTANGQPVDVCTFTTDQETQFANGAPVMGYYCKQGVYSVSDEFALRAGKYTFALACRGSTACPVTYSIWGT